MVNRRAPLIHHHRNQVLRSRRASSGEVAEAKVRAALNIWFRIFLLVSVSAIRQYGRSEFSN